MIAMPKQYFLDIFAKLGKSRVSTRRTSAIAKSMLDIFHGAEQRAKQASEHPHLNDAGKRAKRHEALFDHFVEHQRSRKELMRLKELYQKDATSFTTPPLAKDDLLGAMLDQEARAIVRSMPQEKRTSLTRLSAGLAAAVARAAPEFSGLSANAWESVRANYIEVAFPERMTALRDDAKGIELAEHLVNQTGDELRKIANFSVGEHEDYSKRVEERLASEETDPEAIDRKVNPEHQRVNSSNNVDEWVAEHRRKHGVSIE